MLHFSEECWSSGWSLRWMHKWDKGSSHFLLSWHLYNNCLGHSIGEFNQYKYFKGCLQSCYQNQVHLVCGCTDPRYLGIGTKIPICGLDKGE